MDFGFFGFLGFCLDFFVRFALCLGCCAGCCVGCCFLLVVSLFLFACAVFGFVCVLFVLLGGSFVCFVFAGVGFGFCFVILGVCLVLVCCSCFPVVPCLSVWVVLYVFLICLVVSLFFVVLWVCYYSCVLILCGFGGLGFVLLGCWVLFSLCFCSISGVLGFSRCLVVRAFFLFVPCWCGSGFAFCLGFGVSCLVFVRGWSLLSCVVSLVFGLFVLFVLCGVVVWVVLLGGFGLSFVVCVCILVWFCCFWFCRGCCCV